VIRRLALAAALCSALVSAATAQAVYRCGAEYRPTPCPGGAPVDVKDTRTDDQRREAAQAARAETKAASQLERERHQREAAANGPAIGGFYTLPRAASQPASAPAKGKAANRKKKPRTPSASRRNDEADLKVG
jgi:hypothetical protein